MKFIDFFAGIGGFRRGMELAGHESAGFCEFDKNAVASYTAMHLCTEEQLEHLKTLPMRERQKEILKPEYRNGEWYWNDITTLNGSDVPKADCWCFGSPCQDVSVSGKQKGLENGERSGLFFEVIRLVKGLREEDKPEWLFMENVKNLLSVESGFDFLRVLIEMESCGYDIEWQLFNSKDFGVPQHRERVFIIGHLRSKGGRKVFPLTGNDGENTAKVKSITHSGLSQALRVYSTDGVSRTLSAVGGGLGAKTGLYEVSAISTPLRGFKQQNGRRIKDPEEPMFTVTTQDVHGIVIKPAVIDDTYPNRPPRIYTESSPTLRADRAGLKVLEVKDGE